MHCARGRYLLKMTGHPVINKRIKFTVVLAFLIAVLVLGREQWLPLIDDYLIVEDDPNPADVIHVIAGDDCRTDYAIQLYKDGDAPVLFFTGGWCTLHQSDHGQHAKALSVAAGVPEEAITAKTDG